MIAGLLMAAKNWKIIALAGLLVALCVAGFLLKHAWQQQATAQANASQYKQAVTEAEANYRALQQEKKAAEQAINSRDAAVQHSKAQATALSEALHHAKDATQKYEACADVRLPDSSIQRLRQQSGRGASDHPHHPAG